MIRAGLLEDDGLDMEVDEREEAEEDELDVDIEEEDDDEEMWWMKKSSSKMDGPKRRRKSTALPAGRVREYGEGVGGANKIQPMMDKGCRPWQWAREPPQVENGGSNGTGTAWQCSRGCDRCFSISVP